MRMHAKAIAVLAAASMGLGVLAGCSGDQNQGAGDAAKQPSEATAAKEPTAADYAGTYLFERMTTTVDGQMTEVAVGDEVGGEIIDHGYAVSTLNEDGTCTLDMGANPGAPMKGTWTVKSAGAIEINTEGQVAEAAIEGGTLTTPSTFEADGKTFEMTFVFKKASSTVRADYAGEYHIQKIAIEKDGKTQEYNLGDDYQGTTLTEDSEISLLNADGTCSLKSDIDDQAIPDGTWCVVGDGEIEIEVDMGQGTSAGAGPTFTIENGVFTQTLETGDNENTTFTYIKK